MKVDEIAFFFYCYSMRMLYGFPVHEIIDICSEAIPRKRCLYLLKKWANKGFYDYGVSLDLGWFIPYRMPDRYRDILNGIGKGKESNHGRNEYCHSTEN